VDLDLTNLLETRAKFNAQLKGTELSVQDFLVKAAALAMIQVPPLLVPYPAPPAAST
jgi:pyruvate/2-oxoglutarate dehydrogenase complex dihydrolipoamide acyltransferase (E2) component